MDTLDSTNNANLSDAAIANAKAAAPWMKFISIFMLVLLGLGAIGAIFTMVASVTIGLVYLIITGIMIFWNIQLLGMGNSLSNLANSGSGNFLEQFFAKQKVFYMIWGIILIIYIVLIIIMLATGATLFNAGMQQPGELPF